MWRLWAVAERAAVLGLREVREPVVSAPAAAQARYPEPQCVHCLTLLDARVECSACDQRAVPLSPFLKAVLG